MKATAQPERREVLADCCGVDVALAADTCAQALLAKYEVTRPVAHSEDVVPTLEGSFADATEAAYARP